MSKSKREQKPIREAAEATVQRHLKRAEKAGDHECARVLRNAWADLLELKAQEVRSHERRDAN